MISFCAKRYDDYKSTGVSWLQEAPVSWEIGRHKDYLSLVNKSCCDSSMKKIGLENIESDTGKYIATDSEFDGNGVQFKENDLLFGKLRPYLKKVYKANFDGNAIGDIFVYRCKRNVTPEFCAYLMISDLYIDVINSSTVGAKMPRVSSSFIANLMVAMPSVIKQTTIVNFLNATTNQIETKINLLTKKVEEYKSLKRALINETVTCGINKNVRKYESGIDWIGEIPEHWTIQRIGTAFEERSEKVNDTDYLPLSVTMKGIVPQLENVAKTDNNDNRKKVCINDFVINSRSDRRGSSGISEYEGSVSVINIVLKPRKHFVGKYLHHLFRSYRFIEEYYRVGRGIVADLWTTRYSVMKAIEFPVPSFEEQQEIADYLDIKTAQIDKIINSIIDQIEKLKELRKTIINDIVTGKIRVTEDGDLS